jgi:hypothetical protein
MSMSTLLRTSIGAALAVAMIGCGYGYPYGSLYTGATIPHDISRHWVTGQAKTGDKSGESCATGILALVAFGDASLDAAKKAAGITDVHSVELHGTNILGIYQQGCTEVHGK